MKLSLLLVCSLLALGGCLEVKVHEEVVQSSISPDGKWKATVVMSDAGATTSRNHSVWLTAVSESDYKKGERVFVADQCYKASIEWSKVGGLKISSDGKVLILMSLYFDVNIEHVPTRS